jgi:hypothetical protein
LTESTAEIASEDKLRGDEGTTATTIVATTNNTNTNTTTTNTNAYFKQR